MPAWRIRRRSVRGGRPKHNSSRGKDAGSARRQQLPQSAWAPGSSHTAAPSAIGTAVSFSVCTTSAGAVTLLARESEWCDRPLHSLPNSCYSTYVLVVELGLWAKGGRNAVKLGEEFGALALTAAVVTTTAAFATDPPKEMKLYVFSSGALNLDKSIIQNGSSGKVQIPVGFYLIRHPKGDVLFDCGNNDRIDHLTGLLGPVRQSARSGPLARHRHRCPARQDQRETVGH